MNSDATTNMWSALPIPAFVIDEAMCVRAINPAAENLIHASAKTVCGQLLSRFVGPSGLALHVVQQAQEQAVSVAQYEVELAWSDRELRLGSLQATRLGPGDGVLLLMHPRGLAEKMDRSLTYRTAARSVTGMAAMLAHEIRNPLAGIKGAAQLLSMNLDDADRELTQLIEDEAERIGKLVERVEAFGDLRPTARQPVNIHDVLHRAVTAARAGFASHARLREEYDPSLPPTAADPDQLLQVFQNLLKNAAEAVPETGGVIAIRTAYRPGVKLTLPGARSTGLPLEVIVADNGAGVPRDLLDNIFDPFVSSKVNGSGLGLSLVSKTLSDHGGIVECNSEPGRTEFRILLPIWAGAGTAPDEIGPDEIGPDEIGPDEIWPAQAGQATKARAR